MNKKYFFHIGCPKTGSTSLQKNVLNHLKDVDYLSVAAYHHEKNEFQLRQDVYDFYTNLCLEPEYEDQKILSDFQDIFLPRINESQKEIIVFSDEHCTTGHLTNDHVSNRLKSLGLDFTIIVVVRNQIDLLRSMYDMHPFHMDIENETHKTVSFKEWIQRMISSSSSNLMKSINYSEMYDVYVSKFGKEKVHFLFYEELVEDSAKFSEKFSSILSVSQDEFKTCLNKPVLNDFSDHSVAKWKQKYFHRIHLSSFVPNFIRKKLIAFFSYFIKSERTEPTPEELDLIKSYYAQSNCEFVDKTNLQLSKYNYPL